MTYAAEKVSLKDPINNGDKFRIRTL